MKNTNKKEDVVKKSSQVLSAEIRNKSDQKWASHKARWNAWKLEKAKAEAKEMLLERSRV